ncbi:MAG TPA: hypothetical protein H9955_11755 [Candidatus Mediterraneibacter cottocaccae]|jgi:hypothetical protein|nr:MAG TPA: hypothetical protein [Caudoviricetes sp.]HJA66964.1 hypothetical protein [Candidatus Mediterraneibacter cottocaccae]
MTWSSIAEVFSEILTALWVAVKFAFAGIGILVFIGMLGIIYILLRELSWYVRGLLKEKLKEEKKDNEDKSV